MAPRIFVHFSSPGKNRQEFSSLFPETKMVVPNFSSFYKGGKKTIFSLNKIVIFFLKFNFFSRKFIEWRNFFRERGVGKLAGTDIWVEYILEMSAIIEYE